MPAQGHIRQRPSGSWAAIFPIRQLDGTIRKRWFGAPTREAAERLRRKIALELAEGTYLDASTTPLAEYLDDWIASLAAKGRRQRTITIYRDAARQHIGPAIGRIPLAKLTARQVEAYYARALDSGRLRGKGGLSSSTVRLHDTVLRGALRQAVRWGMLAKSPMDAVERPGKAPSKARALGAAELETLLLAVHGTALEVPALLGCFCGMRRGEILALQWADVDFEASALRVTASKTAAGIRTIALPPLVLTALRTERLRSGRVAGPVVLKPDGKPWRPSSLTEAFERLAAAAGLGHVRFHDTRHTAATTLIGMGAALKAVSGRLGHSSIATTADIYSHYLREHDAALAEMLEARYGENRR